MIRLLIIIYFIIRVITEKSTKQHKYIGFMSV